MALSPRARRIVRRLTIGLLVVAVVGLVHRPLLRAVGQALVVDQPVDAPQQIVIYGGDRCYQRAAELYHQDPARRITIVERFAPRLVRLGSMPSFVSICRRQLAARGVPEDAVAAIAGDGPPEQALAAWLGEQPNDCVTVILCEQFGSRWLQIVLADTLPAARMASVRIQAVPDRRYDASNWWRVRSGAKELVDQWIALLYARFGGPTDRGGQAWDPDRYQRELGSP